MEAFEILKYLNVSELFKLKSFGSTCKAHSMDSMEYSYSVWIQNICREFQTIWLWLRGYIVLILEFVD